MNARNMCVLIGSVYFCIKYPAIIFPIGISCVAAMAVLVYAFWLADYWTNADVQ